ncbi:MAG: hypothetical protein V1652_01300 [bacterium]
MYYRNENQFKDENGYIIDDLWYPRVTSIVQIKSKPALAFFYQDVGSQKKADEIKQRAADEGTLVHETAQAIMLGKTPIVDDNIKPAIEAFINFFGHNDIRTEEAWIEKRIAHRDERYAGTVDALAHINGKFGVMDIKTSQAIYRDYNLQTAAYFASLHDTFCDLETRWILRIDQQQTCRRCGATLRTKGGREKIKNPYYDGLVSPCPKDEHEWGDVKGIIEFQEFPYWHDDYNAFLGAKRLWEWEHNYWLRKIGY